jgi:hypothetical protein
VEDKDDFAVIPTRSSAAARLLYRCFMQAAAAVCTSQAHYRVVMNHIYGNRHERVTKSLCDQKLGPATIVDNEQVLSEVGSFATRGGGGCVGGAEKRAFFGAVNSLKLKPMGTQTCKGSAIIASRTARFRSCVKGAT